MSKRSNFEKRPRDYYATVDNRAGDALAPFIQDVKYFAEPFAGNGALIYQLQERHGKYCMWKSDLLPQPDISFGLTIHQMDYTDVSERCIYNSDVLITNPPFTKELFHGAIEHFTPMIDCWWLMQADWIFNLGSVKLLDKYVTDIITIGRLKWFLDSPHSSTDNFVWVKTSAVKYGDIRFHNRRK